MIQRDKGQSLTEFALTLPILLLLLLGIIEGARIIWAYITVQQAAREAARFAITGGPLDANGDPWVPQNNDKGGVRFQAIVKEAEDRSIGPGGGGGLNASVRATDSYEDPSQGNTYQAYFFQPSALGVAVRGQDGNQTFHWDFGGEPGYFVEVHVYYNVEMLDPIFQVLLPNGYLHLEGKVVMQNEGIDSSLGNIPPIPPPPVPTPIGGGDPGVPTPYLEVDPQQTVYPDGYPAGTTVAVNMFFHDPLACYKLLFDAVEIAYGIDPDGTGFARVENLQIPVSTSPGEHTFYSRLCDDTGSQYSVTIQVAASSAAVTINLLQTGAQVPPKQCVTVALLSHDPNKIGYTFIATPTLSALPPAMNTDASGDASPGSPNYTIPDGTAAGLYLLSSVDPTPPGGIIASGSFRVTSPALTVQGGTTWPAGTNILTLIDQHAPGREYTLRFNGSQVDSAKTANSNGQANFSFAIPVGTANGNYTLASHDECGNVIVETTITVTTPAGPFIVVPGGTTWPAGSPITIQARKHVPGDYDLYFGANFIGTFTTDAGGNFTTQTPYVIPVSTPQGAHAIRTEPFGGGPTAASLNVEVLAVPYLEIAGGTTWQPGSTITVSLKQHAANGIYNMFLNNNDLSIEVTTNASGEATFQYVIPSNASSGTYPLASRQAGIEVATIDLIVIASDLLVANIEFPPNPVFNKPQPITLTVTNNSDIDLTGEIIDVDVYVDPLIPPTATVSLPPGDRKQWLQGISANSSVMLYESITLVGSGQHRVYGRVDTSDFVIETNEFNNILDGLVDTTVCALEVADEFDDGSVGGQWTKTNFGDAAPSTVSEPGGVLVLTSRGRSTFDSDDNSNNAGLAFLHQQVSSDFDMRVRVLGVPNLDKSSKGGLAVRQSLAGTSPKIELALTRDNGVQAFWRNGGNTNRPPAPYDNDAPASAPVWLRITRTGNTFEYYFAPASGSIPPAITDWVFRGSVDVPMSDPVYVGLFNASYKNNQGGPSSFDNFHVCVDPASPDSCGEVQEKGGQVVINAPNFGTNLNRGGHSWITTSQNGLVGMQATPDNGIIRDTGYTTTSPELQYQVDFSSTGTYYVWVMGWGPNTTGRSVHVGLNDMAVDTADRISPFPSGGSTPGWLNATMDGPRATINVSSSGSQTINVWMREDGFKFFKILLTTNAGFTPSDLNMDQSPCTSDSSPIEGLPPGFKVCNVDFQQQGFEGTKSEVDAVWPNGGILNGTNNHNTIKYEGNFGALLSSLSGGLPRRPWMYQEFVMPELVLTTTTGTLNFWKAVYGQGAPAPDPFYFVLRDTNGLTLTNPILIAMGNETPQFNPASPSQNDWTNFGATNVITQMIAAGNDPADYAGQRLQAYFYAPNNTVLPAHANLYLDNVNLQVCSVVPTPPPDSAKGTFGGIVRIPAAGTLVAKSGVTVWAYAFNGPLFKTFSIQGGNYGFYNIPPGQYTVFAEYQQGPTIYQKTIFVTVAAGATDFGQDLNLVVAGGQ